MVFNMRNLSAAGFVSFEALGLTPPVFLLRKSTHGHTGAFVIVIRFSYLITAQPLAG